MEANEGDSVCPEGEAGNVSSGFGAENEQQSGDDTAAEAGVGKDDDDDGQFEVQLIEEDDGGSDEKKDDNMVVVDELCNEELQSDGDDEAAEAATADDADVAAIGDDGDKDDGGGDDDDHSTTDEESAGTGAGLLLDPERSERNQLSMPSMSAVTRDLMALRQNRRVSVYPLSMSDLMHDDIQLVLDNPTCEAVKFQMVRSSADPKTWAGFLALSFSTSTAAAPVVETMKSLKEGITAKIDTNPDQSAAAFVKSEGKAKPWPASCTDRLLLVRGLSSATKPEELRTAVFKDAAEIVVVKDPAVTCPNVNRKLEKSYANRGEDGYAYVLYEDAETAKSVVEEFTEDPPMFLAHVLDVKLYRHPIAEIPKALLYLRQRKLALKQLDKMTKNLEKSTNDPNFKLAAGTEKRIQLCKQLIDKDDRCRQLFGLPTPSLEEFKAIHGLKPATTRFYQRWLTQSGIFDPSTQTPPKQGFTDPPTLASSQQNVAGNRGRGRGQPGVRGRGQPGARGRGQPMARGRGQPTIRGTGQAVSRGRGQTVSGSFRGGRGSATATTGRGAGVAGRGTSAANRSHAKWLGFSGAGNYGSQGNWGTWSAGRDKYMGQSLESQLPKSYGTMSKVANLMQFEEPDGGLMRSVGSKSKMMSAGGSGSVGGASLLGQSMAGRGGGGGYSGYFRPPAKMMRLDDRGGLTSLPKAGYRYPTSFSVYDDDSGPLLPPEHRFYSGEEYRSPPSRSQHGGNGSLFGSGRDVGGPRGYVPGADEDIDVLMQMLSQKMQQKRRHNMY